MTGSHRRAIAALGLAALLPIGADDPPKKTVQDPQSAVEPRTSVGAGQAFLERFVGDWDVAKAFYPPRGGEPVRVAGTCRQEMIHAGRFLRSEFVFGEGAARTTGLGLIGFEPEPGIFTSVWTDSRQTKMSARQGREKFDGREIVLHSKSLEPDGKEGRTSRTVTRLEDDGRRVVHRQYNPTPDGQERLLMELVMTRKPTTGRAPATQ